MNLLSATQGQEYRVSAIQSGDEEMDSFLFSLGCYEDQPITVVSHLRSGCVVSIKDGRYTLDRELAKTIEIC